MTENLIPTIYAKKVAAYLQADIALLRNLWPEPTPEQKADWEKRREARDAYELALSEHLGRQAEPVASVASLHAADEWGHCSGCDLQGWEAESVDWPCRTSVLLGSLTGLVEVTL